MNPFILPWLNVFKSPLSGDVSQDISPTTSWLSPQIEFNFAGNRQVESKVVAEVASYGKQLGIIADAVLELAEGKPGDSVEQLKSLTEQIAQIKQKHSQNLEENVKKQLAQLQQQDPKAVQAILKQYQ